MTLELAKALVEASEGGLILYPDYSGRGMFGMKTAAVSGSPRAYIRSVRSVASVAPDDIDAEEIDDLRTDSLGRDTIYY